MKNSDSDLVARVQAGETGAFDEIDRRYRESLCRFLARYALGPEHADELVQRTLIRAYEMMEQLQSGEKLAGWLYRIAFRMAAAEGRRRTILSLDFLASLPTGRIEPAVHSPDALSEEEEKRGIWKIAKDRLTDEEFRILSLRYREDFSPAQIAETIGKKEGAVRVQLHRARKKLLPYFERAES